MRHDDPRSWLGWLARDRRHWGIESLKKAILAVALLSVYALFVGQTLAWALLLGALVPLAKAFPPREPGPLPADPPPGPAFSGVVEVWRERALLGEDRVVATFVDGWLVVEGLRTTFSLTSDDLVLQERENALWPTLSLTDGTELRFRLRSLDFERQLDDIRQSTKRSLKAPFRSSEIAGARTSKWSTFERALARWREGMVPEGESVLPPDRPHPSAVVRAASELLVSAAGFVATFLVLGFFGLGWGLLAIVATPAPPLGNAIRTLVRLRRLEAP